MRFSWPYMASPSRGTKAPKVRGKPRIASSRSTGHDQRPLPSDFSPPEVSDFQPPLTHPRSRPLLLCYFTAPLLLAPFLLWMGYPLAEALSTSLPLLALPAFAWLYLYRKRTVLEYYSALTRR